MRNNKIDLEHLDKKVIHDLLVGIAAQVDYAMIEEGVKIPSHLRETVREVASYLGGKESDLIHWQQQINEENHEQALIAHDLRVAEQEKIDHNY